MNYSIHELDPSLGPHITNCGIFTDLSEWILIGVGPQVSCSWCKKKNEQKAEEAKQKAEAA